MKGRKPQPTNIRLITGNAGKRAVPEDVPELPVVAALPDPPEQLSQQARVYWPELAKQLRNMRVLTDADLPALAMLCESYATYWEAMEGVRTHGIISVTPNKYIVRSEYLNTASKAMSECLKILTEFGLTPSSRTKVRTE